MADNVLQGGLDVCMRIRDDLKSFNEARSGAEAAKAAAVTGEKTVKNMEKSVKDEIVATVKKRKEDLERTYDSEIDILKQRTKAVKDEKDKERDEQQAKRIEDETAGNREKERELLLEIRSVFKRDGIPSIFNNKLYYALFMPRTFVEILVLVAAILITLVGIPSLIVFVFMKNPSTFQTMLVQYACVFLFIGLYLLISYFTKVKYRASFAEILKLRREIRANRKDMRSTSHRVQRDKDDSKYDLGQYDAEMERIKGEIDRINEKKKEELKIFETTTKDVIASQIEEKHREEIEELRNFVAERTKEEAELAEKAKEMSLHIAKNYEPIIGKANLTVELFDKAVQFMESGAAANVEKALEMAKNPENSLAPDVVNEPAGDQPEDVSDDDHLEEFSYGSDEETAQAAEESAFEKTPEA